MLKKVYCVSIHANVGRITLLVVAALSTIFAMSLYGNEALALDSSVVTQPAYLLTVNVPSHPFGTSTIGIAITTENGYTDQANIPAAGNPSWTFSIPPNQGNSVQVCVNSGSMSQENCQIYKTTGSNMLVTLPALSRTGSISSDVGSSNSNNSNDHNDSNKNRHHESNTSNNFNTNINRNRHNADIAHSNSNGINTRTGSHHSDTGNDINSNSNGNSSSNSQHWTNRPNGLGVVGSGTGGSNSHNNGGSSNTNNNNSPRVPLVQFVGPVQ